MCDVLTVSTEPLKLSLQKLLKDVYGIVDKPIFVCPNFINPEEWNSVKYYPSNQPVIGYYGSTTHNEDLAMVMPSIIKVLEKYPLASFELIGACHQKDVIELMRPWAGKEVLDRIRTAGGLKGWEGFPELLLRQNWDISIAPLTEDGFNRCKCVIAGTRVVTNAGIIPIEKITKGIDVVLENTDRKVIDTFNYQAKPTVKITTKSGYEIEGTSNHKLQDNNGEWKMISDIKVGDKLKIQPFDLQQREYQSLKYPLFLTKSIRGDIFAGADNEMLPRIVINERWGLLLGLLFGDGHMHGFNRVGISCSTDYMDIIELCENLFQSIGLRATRIKKVNGHIEGGPVTKEGKGIDVIANSRNLRNVFESAGFTGAKGKVFKIPDIIFKSPKSVIANFIAGLFEADGCVTESGLSFTTKGEQLAKDVLFILLGFGIKAKLFPRFNKKYNKFYYNISLGRESAEIFEKEIGFVSKQKKAKLQLVTSKKHSNAFIKFDWEDEVVSVTPGINDVFDIEVEEKHYYLANGFVSHNSHIKWMESSMKSIPVVASDVYPYTEPIHKTPVIEHKKTGLISSDKDWFKHLSELIEFPDLRVKLGKQAREAVLKNWSADSQIKHWKKALDSIIDLP